MKRRVTVVLLFALYAAWKTFYSVQTDAESWRVALFGVAAAGFGVLAAVGWWRQRQAAAREAG